MVRLPLLLQLAEADDEKVLLGGPQRWVVLVVLLVRLPLALGRPVHPTTTEDLPLSSLEVGIASCRILENQRSRWRTRYRPRNLERNLVRYQSSLCFCLVFVNGRQTRKF